MMGRLNHDHQLFYAFHLEEAVPQEHSIRKIAAVLDLSWIAHARYWRAHGHATINRSLDKLSRRPPGNVVNTRSIRRRPQQGLPQAHGQWPHGRALD